MLIEIPDKCYEVSWCLGWEIKEWSIYSLQYSVKENKIVKIYVERPHYVTYFQRNDFNKTIFFDYATALQKLKEKENSKETP